MIGNTTDSQCQQTVNCQCRQPKGLFPNQLFQLKPSSIFENVHKRPSKTRPDTCLMESVAYPNLTHSCTSYMENDAFIAGDKPKK